MKKHPESQMVINFKITPAGMECRGGEVIRSTVSRRAESQPRSGPPGSGQGDPSPTSAVPGAWWTGRVWREGAGPGGRGRGPAYIFRRRRGAPLSPPCSAALNNRRSYSA